MGSLGVGIVGTGGIASGGHGPAIRSCADVNLIGVLSRDAARGRSFLDTYGAVGDARVHTSIDTFVADKAIDLAIICSPDRLHARHARACLENGKHVLLEKPMTTDLSDADDLIRIAKENRLVLGSGFHLRHHRGHQLLKERIESGAIGRIRHIRAIWAFSQYDDSNWRAQGALGKWWSLAAVGAHCIDLARWFTGDNRDWESFHALIDTGVWGGLHDETAVIAARLQSGITVETTSSIQFGTYHRVELFGDKSIAICDSTLGRVGGGVITIGDETLAFEPVSPFLSELEDVVRAITHGCEPKSDAEAGRRSVADLLLALDV